MKTLTTRVRTALVAGLAGGICAGLALAPGCGRPTDDAWLQFLGFQQGGSTIGVFRDALRGESTATVDVQFQNGSMGVGLKSGTGVFLTRARIDYRMNGFFPPSADVPLNLFLEAPSDGKSTTGTLSGFPLAPTSLKHWLINTGAFKDANAVPVVELTAQVTFYAEASDGTDLETKGNIKIELTNSASTTSSTVPTLTVAWNRNVSRALPGTTGAFTVFRSDLGANLTVLFSTGGGETTVNADYTIDSPVVISGSASSVEVKVTPVPSSGINGKVVITLLGSSDYKLGEPKIAQLSILP